MFAPARGAKVIGMTTSATPEEKRALAQQARLARAARIMQLRRQVLAAAAATFVLATGVVAWDGSMGGEMTSASPATAASGSVLVEDAVQSDTGDGWSDAPTESSDAASSADVLTTQQS